MPTWNIKCDCGGRQSRFVTLASRRRAGGKVPCSKCGALNEARPSAPHFTGFGTVKVGERELTTREADAWAEKNGKVLLGPNSPERKRLKEQAREGADRSAAKQGFKDVEHRRREWAKKKAKILTERRARQIDAYHKRLGTDKGKQSPDEAFGKPE